MKVICKKCGKIWYGWKIVFGPPQPCVCGEKLIINLKAFGCDKRFKRHIELSEERR